MSQQTSRPGLGSEVEPPPADHLCLSPQFEGTREAEDICCFWQNFLHPSINKTPWSQQEVQLLREVSRRHQERDWESIAAELGVSICCHSVSI